MCVFKYGIPPEEEFKAALPLGAEILKIAVQNDIPQMWVLVDPEAPIVERSFCITGTGQDLPNTELRYVGTFFMQTFVFHVFEKLEVSV